MRKEVSIYDIADILEDSMNYYLLKNNIKKCELYYQATRYLYEISDHFKDKYDIRRDDFKIMVEDENCEYRVFDIISDAFIEAGGDYR